MRIQPQQARRRGQPVLAKVRPHVQVLRVVKGCNCQCIRMLSGVWAEQGGLMGEGEGGSLSPVSQCQRR